MSSTGKFLDNSHRPVGHEMQLKCHEMQRFSCKWICIYHRENDCNLLLYPTTKNLIGAFKMLLKIWGVQARSQVDMGKIHF